MIQKHLLRIQHRHRLILSWRFLCAEYELSALFRHLNGKMQVDGAELYFLTTPGGAAGQLKVSSRDGRLENGIMISQNALDELGEKEFIKMLRFIDWLWYSDEGQTLALWGVEGETYSVDDDGNIVLNSDIYYNGINPGAEKQLNVDYGLEMEYLHMVVQRSCSI